MAFRTEEIKLFKNIVICDDCGYETKLGETIVPMGFDNRMNGALSKGYTFKADDNGRFKNYCKKCKLKHN